MKKVFLTLLIYMVCYLSGIAQVETWKMYPSYYEITEIQPAGNTIFVLASGALFSYHKNDNSVQTYDKTTVLNDVDIAHIAYNKAVKRLVIVYKNGNIDLLNLHGNIVNISDFYTKDINQEKTVYAVDIDGIYAYLSTNFGIIKLNVRKAEISDTYQLGFKVNWSHINNGKIIAESSSHGKYSAALSSNLLDKNNWKYVGAFTPKKQPLDEKLKKEAEKYRPEGPKYNYFGSIKVINNILYSTSGGYGPDGDDARLGTAQILDTNNKWIIYDDNLEKKIGHQNIDNLSIDVDPNDNTHIFVSGRTGLYEFKNKKLVKHYNIDNSPLQSALGNNNIYTVIESIKFDKDGNLWLLNSMASSQSIIELTKEGKWISHHTTALLNKNKQSLGAMQGLMFDSRSMMWFVNRHWVIPSFFCYQPSIKLLKSYKKFINTDNDVIEVNRVECIAEDLEHNIWIGTNTGPLLLKASQISQNDNVKLEQIKINRNDGTNLADYLLNGVHIYSMAIDGANRLWFGTLGNGVYLISSDYTKEIKHFTKANSPLLSNNIESIAINNTTGEVFFGTDKGLCSYLSDANLAQKEMTKETVYAYPNPVDPNYNGLITITGLSFNSDIKIVTSNGILVSTGRSNGGIFIWDGKDLNGNRVASGIYMVQTADNNGDKGTICKIAIIR